MKKKKVCTILPSGSVVGARVVVLVVVGVGVVVVCVVGFVVVLVVGFVVVV